MIHLSKRLSSIYKLTPHDITIDVGADHGQLIISLVENNVIERGYAVENKKGPFERLVKAINASKVKDKIVPIFASGIKKMPKDTKTVIIAGMGGPTIINILKDDKDKLDSVDTILIDSHGAFFDVRKEISSLGFYIDMEEVVEEDDIFYEIMRFKKGHKDYTDDDYFFGPILWKEKSQLFIKRWNKRKNDIETLLCNDEIPIHRKTELKNELERINKAL